MFIRKSSFFLKTTSYPVPNRFVEVSRDMKTNCWLVSDIVLQICMGKTRTLENRKGMPRASPKIKKTKQNKKIDKWINLLSTGAHHHWLLMWNFQHQKREGFIFAQIFELNASRMLGKKKKERKTCRESGACHLENRHFMKRIIYCNLCWSLL